MSERPSATFHAVHVVRASQDIVEQIKASIFAGKFAPGDRLPSEKELGEQFDLSRITVRDALRVLESKGLITIKVGAGGGAFVANPNPTAANEIVTDLLRLQGTTTKELVEARLIIETSIVKLAAERATGQDIAAMEQAIAAARLARASGDPHFTPYSVSFHVALAQAAKNTVLLFTVNSFRTLFYDTLERLQPDERMAERAIQDHQNILSALVAHDPERALDIMRKHLAYFEKRAEKKPLWNDGKG